MVGLRAGFGLQHALACAVIVAAGGLAQRADLAASPGAVSASCGVRWIGCWRRWGIPRLHK
jgi:hypothetical protein